jgi:hypothetical protein
MAGLSAFAKAPADCEYKTRRGLGVDWDPAIHLLLEEISRRLMDRRVESEYDQLRSLLFRKLGRCLARHLPEGMGKCRDAGVAQIGGKLLDRDIGIRRQLFDRRRDAGALAPALEAKLRLR